MGDKREFLRWAGIIFSILVILGSGYYSYRYAQEHVISFKDCLKNPEVLDGKILVLNYRKVITVGPGYFKIREGETEVKVEGDIPGIKEGDIITVRGIFNKKGYLNLTKYYFSPYRNVKYIVSCLGLVLPFVWLSFYFRFNLKDFTLVEKN